MDRMPPPPADPRLAVFCAIDLPTLNATGAVQQRGSRRHAVRRPALAAGAGASAAALEGPEVDRRRASAWETRCFDDAALARVRRSGAAPCGRTFDRMFEPALRRLPTRLAR